MVKILFSAVLAIASIALTSVADELPDEARKALKEMERKIENEQRETEKKIVRKKEDTIRTLERVEKKIDNEFAKNLIKTQLVKYRKEIEESKAKFGKEDKERERNNKGVDMEAQAMKASEIIDFDKSYFYRHPLTKVDEIGELRFYSNGKVNCFHRDGSTVKMFKKWDWNIDDGKIVIQAGKFHGLIYVSKKSPKEIDLDWKGMINKKNVAKQK